MNTAMVKVDAISKKFDSFVAVNNLSLTVNKGEVLGLLGPNGSGKSTSIRMITGFLEPTEGSVEICGVDLLRDPIAAQKCVGYLPEGASAYTDITPLDYLKFIANVHQLTPQESDAAIQRVVSMVKLHGVLNQAINTLSKGFKRRLGLAQALLHDPMVLVLDEPTDGLDPNQKREIRQLIQDIAPEKAIIISTHLLEEVQSVCSRVVVVSAGQKVAEGKPEDLIKQSDNYNAVTVTVAKDQSHALAVYLETFAEIERVEKHTDLEVINQEDCVLKVIPKQKAHILSLVAYHTFNQSWGIRSLDLYRYYLDDVFQQLTENNDAEISELPKYQSLNHGSQNNKKKIMGCVLPGMASIMKREALGYLSSPIACIFMMVFIMAIGAFTFFLGGFFTLGQASLDSFFQFHSWLYLFLIPALSMRLWAEERSTGSIEVLLTLPISTVSAVLGKFIAAWLVVLLTLILSTTIWGTVNYLGNPDNSAIASGYLGSFLMAGGYLAIGSCLSALTRNQVIAFILSVSVCFAFTASGLNVVLDFFSGWAPQTVLQILSGLSFISHYKQFVNGVIDIGSVVFFISTIMLFITMNVFAVERYKAS